jgi:N-acetylglucosaminyl-diphospho-decaprenol L-rhamnosyltransferase
MMVRKGVLDQTGGFDERFFMYAEDIDLSFRIHQHGFKNFYLADTTIIHFKGQSTTKDRLYVKLFYQAMVQFVEKHYSHDQHRLYRRLLKIAISLRGLFELGIQKFKNRRPADHHLRFSIDGDKTSISEVEALGLPQETITQPPDRADGVILCEGKEMPFTMVIEKMKRAAGKHYSIHALGSSSVVGDLLCTHNKAIYEPQESR